MNTNNLETKNNQLEDYVLKTDESDNGNLLSNNNQDVSHKDSSPKEEQVKFNSLSPTKLKDIDPIYKKAFDFAFSNDDIKNIAITGIYGAGKSTVWNSYVDQTKIDNIITVSLGAYNNANNDSNENNETFEVNRIERQLINQILSQINPDLIPLSKFAFKRNKNGKFICIIVLLFIMFFIGVILLLTRDAIFNIFEQSKPCYKILYLIVCSCFLIIPLSLLVFWLLKNDKLKVSKINFKGTEANFEIESKEETVLDRDIKEIVYLLDNAGASVLVFEDLDRYENINIFTKLRELNYLLNSFIKINGDNRVVRFVYMIKDGVFYSKDRTKFFDFIIPIVPIVDSNTSDNELMKLLKDTSFIPDSKVVTDISLYVDDMRLLKNIVNEYIIYSNIIPLSKLKLNKNKLFSLIVLKNVYPKEFDSLQNDEGFIIDVFNKINNNRIKIRNKLNKEISEIENHIIYLKEQKEKNIFDTMALMIPANVKTESTSFSWSELLKTWETNPEERKYIYYSNNSGYFVYDEFVKKFIFARDDAENTITKIKDSNEVNLNVEYQKINNKKEEISKINSYSYKQIISNLSQEDKDDVFMIDINNVQNHYFPLIRYLIVNGLLDETYYFYKGIFNVDKNVLLKQNDIVYYKSLLEEGKVDCLFEISTPSEIVNRLDEKDYSKTGIINKDIVRYCLNNCPERFDKIYNTVIKFNKFDDLLIIIDYFDIHLIKKMVKQIINYDTDSLVTLVHMSSIKGNDSFLNLLASIITCNEICRDETEAIISYFEENEGFCQNIIKKDFDTFIKNLNLCGIKFKSIEKTGLQKEQLYSIEKICAYELNISNVLYLLEKLNGHKIKYGELLKIIYEETSLIHTKEYIEDNFDVFVTKYINQRPNHERFDNGTKLLEKILLSTISIDERVTYAKNNDTLIEDFSKFVPIINDIDIISSLFEQNSIAFNNKNIKLYWENCKDYSIEFLSYLERHINRHNSKKIFENNNAICNSLIMNNSIDKNLFINMLPFCDKKVETIDTSMELERLHLLIKYNLIRKTNKNIELLYNNNMYNEIIHIIVSSGYDEQEEIVDYLLNLDIDGVLIYKLINANISLDATKNLIDCLGDNIMLNKIKKDREEIIKYVLLNYLTKNNIDYICDNLDTFKFKRDFVRVLDKNYNYETLDNENLNRGIMNLILTSDVSTEMKVAAIITKINNNTSAHEIENYINKVEEVKEISTVWKGKFPSVDNLYKEDLSEALIENNYVKERNGEERRIMALKK